MSNDQRTPADIDLDLAASVAYSAAVADICDALGLRLQTAAPTISCLHSTGTLVGWARTFRSHAVDAPPHRHYGGEIDFIDSLRPGDVAVGDASGSEAAAWGELFSTAAVGRGARGIVVDGFVRDIARIRERGFPVHARGVRPTDSLGRVSLEDHDVPIEVGGVPVRPGDLIVADLDGIVVVPQESAAEVIRRAIAKATVEDDARDLLLAGGTLANVWERFGVL